MNNQSDPTESIMNFVEGERGTHPKATPPHSDSGTHDDAVPGSSRPAPKVDRALILGQDGRWVAGWALRFIVMAGAAYILWLGLAQVWQGLLPILLAILMSTVLWPPVKWLRDRGINGGIASALVLIAMFAAIGGLFASMAPNVSSQTKILFAQAMVGIRTIQEWMKGPPLNLDAEGINEIANEVVSRIQAQASSQAGNIASGVFSGLSAASSVGVTIGVALVLTFFFLKDGDQFIPWVRKNVGETAGWHLTEVLTRTWNTLAGFIRAQAIVSFIDAVFIGIGLIALGVPLALVLATITFFAGFIPIIGAVSAGAISVLIALVSNGPTTAILVLILILVVQQVEGNILSPMLQSKAMNLHPVIVLLAVLVGGGLFGIVGAFLSVPVAAAIAVWIRYHAEMVSLRTGETTVDDIEIETKNASASHSKHETIRNIKARMQSLVNRRHRIAKQESSK
ncbi:AI-2E family transporter [Corynebacterium freiburgense]|uniref:AI-2E family transporter n=1 Tax=Corynebacterium freiburgense TaxID=556548 RepID=UPI00041E9D3F|nr:AI-2E family transporter [Corynebacterium freiburgense]